MALNHPTAAELAAELAGTEPDSGLVVREMTWDFWSINEGAGVEPADIHGA